MKKCPFCAEEIQDEAIKCRFCGSFLSSAPPAQGAPAPTAAPPPAASERQVAADPTPPPQAAAPPPALQPAASPPPAGPPAGQAERKVLYSGSPSWRAYFKEYFLTVLASLLVPFLSLWIARKLDATRTNMVLAFLMPVAVGAVVFAAIHLYRRSKVFRVTTTNIETEHGLVTKKIDVLELWRCRDVQYRQSIMDRLLGIAHIDIHTTDVTTPNLCIVGLPASRELFEQIRDSIEIQRHARNVVGFVQ